MIVRIVAVAWVLVVLATGVGADTPRISANRAIALATAAAHKKHLDLTSHLPAKVRYYAKGHSWTVWWDERPDKNGMVTIGGDYTASVDAFTGKVHFIPGR